MKAAHSTQVCKPCGGRGIILGTGGNYCHKCGGAGRVVVSTAPLSVGEAAKFSEAK